MEIHITDVMDVYTMNKPLSSDQGKMVHLAVLETTDKMLHSSGCICEGQRGLIGCGSSIKNVSRNQLS